MTNQSRNYYAIRQESAGVSIVDTRTGMIVHDYSAAMVDFFKALRTCQVLNDLEQLHPGFLSNHPIRLD